jgi:S1-C subfamily serine protease/ribosomal protein S27E
LVAAQPPYLVTGVGLQMANVKCPHCKALLAVDDPVSWQSATCSTCGRTFRKSSGRAASVLPPPKIRPPDPVPSPPPVPPPLPAKQNDKSSRRIKDLAAGAIAGVLTVGVLVGVVGLVFLIGMYTGSRHGVTKSEQVTPTPSDAASVASSRATGPAEKAVREAAGSEEPLAHETGREATSGASAEADGMPLDSPNAFTPSGPVVWLPDRRVADAPTQAKHGPGKPTRTQNSAPMKLADLVERTEPSVVRISADRLGSTAVGSGFVVDSLGTVVTNLHVVEGSREATVEFRDGTAAKVLGIVYLDPRRDIALLRIPVDSRRPNYLRLAPNEPRKGDDVATFGAPLGLSFTTSSGIVSAIRSGSDLSQFLQSLHQRIGAEQVQPYKGTWLQTTAPISHGNSGGPLVDFYGDVVGMSTMTFNPIGGENVNFAISVSDIRTALEIAKSRSVVSFAEVFPQARPPRAGSQGKRNLGTQGRP